MDFLGLKTLTIIKMPWVDQKAREDIKSNDIPIEDKSLNC